MKIRTGYVSNSSSSSFCIMGYVIEREQFKQVKQQIEKNIELTYSQGLGDNFYDEQFIVGQSVYKMSEQQTGLQFKQQVFENLVKIFPNITINDVNWCIDRGYED